MEERKGRKEEGIRKGVGGRKGILRDREERMATQCSKIGWTDGFKEGWKDGRKGRKGRKEGKEGKEERKERYSKSIVKINTILTEEN